jgi:hypothetical protein
VKARRLVSLVVLRDIWVANRKQRLHIVFVAIFACVAVDSSFSLLNASRHQ